MMVIGSCEIVLHLPESFSLKDKRSIIKSIIARARREFNIAMAEVEYHDRWQTAGLGVVTVSTDQAYSHGLFEKLITWIERERPDVEVQEYRVEFL